MELVEIKVGKWTLKGIAVSALYSTIAIENYKILFDVGVITPNLARCPTVLVTHGHHDHCAGLYRHNRFRRLSKDQIETWKPPVYVVPKVCMTGIRQMYLGFLNLDAGKQFKKLQKLHPNYVPLEPNGIFNISEKMYTKAFKTDHRVPSQGYTIYEVRTKLRPEYAGLSGKEIAEKRKAGEDVVSEVHLPTVSYTGDTTIDGIICHPDVLHSEMLIMECTFLDDQIDVNEARKRGHVHIYDVIKHQHLFENKHVVLCHFSNRYKAQQVKDLVQNYYETGQLTETFYNKLHCFV